jgi:hypothetical protein
LKAFIPFPPTQTNSTPPSTDLFAFAKSNDSIDGGDKYVIRYDGLADLNQIWQPQFLLRGRHFRRELHLNMILRKANPLRLKIAAGKPTCASFEGGNGFPSTTMRAT